MSSQNGKTKRKPQKYQNSMAFRNDLHDTSRKTKALNRMVVGGVCSRCKEQIEWKIRYKKYKPLTQPKKCVKCEQKTITQAYHIMCKQCATADNVCAKCGNTEDIVTEHGLSPAEEASQASQLESELKHLSERQRRAFFRHQAKGCQDGGDVNTKESRQMSKDGELDDDNAEVESKDEAIDVNDRRNELDDRTSST